MKRGASVLFAVVFLLFFSLAVHAQYSVESVGIPGTSDYVDYTGNNLLTGAITGMQTATRGSTTGPSQSSSSSPGECTVTHIEAVAAKIEAKKRTLDLLEADLSVQITKLKASLKKLSAMQWQMGAMWKTCSSCPGYDAGNVTINDKNYTNVTVACEKCTTTTLMRTLTKIKAQYIDIKAEIVKIKLEIKRIHAEITQIKVELKALQADLFNCKFDCPPCPPGTVAAPVTGAYGISCSGGVIRAFAATVDAQIGHIEAMLVKIDIEFKKIDITIDTIDILIDEIKKTEVTCVDCLMIGDEVLEEEKKGVGLDKSQVDVAKQVGLTDTLTMQVEESKQKTRGNRQVWHTRLSDGTREITVETYEPFPATGEVQLTMSGGRNDAINLQVIQRPKWSFLRFLGFGVDKTMEAKIVFAKVNEEVIYEEPQDMETRKVAASMPACGGCSTKNLWALFLKIQVSHQKISAAMLKVHANIQKAHVDFVKVSATFKEQAAKFMKCSFNCPKCVRLANEPQDAYRVGDDYPTSRTTTGTSVPQEQIAVGGSGTQTQSCSEICASKGMVTSMPDHSSYILNYLNSNGVCKKSASVSFGNYLRSGECTCYPSNPPSISVSGDISCSTPCGEVPCNSGTQCSCGDNCIMTVSCKWGGWRQVGAQSYQPVVSASS